MRRRVLELTVSKVKERNTCYDQREILGIIDEEVDAVREDRS